MRQFLAIVNETLKLHIPASEVAIEGELSGFTVKDGKWLIFQLKDEEEASVKVNCFSTVYKIHGMFEDGMRVRVYGAPVVKPWSAFQIDVQSMEAVGEGALKRAYDLLKKKLEDEGLFAPSRKRVLPRFPERIGLVTSCDAAAYGDFLRILNNRWGGVRVMHADVHVQGKEAVSEIVSAFQFFQQLPEGERPEAIVLTRGGGSLEDLHAFNDEAVARSVFGSTIPVVCGVGHERDESLCDFVADVRASTPSNAAERIVPERSHVAYEISAMTERTKDQLVRSIDRRSGTIDTATHVMARFLASEKMRFDATVQRLFVGTSGWMMSLRNRIEAHDRLLKNLDPTRILSRGYSIVTRAGHVVKDATTLHAGERIEVQFGRGKVSAEVTE